MVRGFLPESPDTVWFQIVSDHELLTPRGKRIVRAVVIDVLRALLVTKSGLTFEKINQIKGNPHVEDQEGVARHFLRRNILKLLEDIGFSLEKYGNRYQRPFRTRDGRFFWMEGVDSEKPKKVCRQNNLYLSKQQWTLEHSPISALLDARYQIVPFIGRKQELEELDQWCQKSPPLSTRTIIGQGGMGKTRLTIELAESMESHGWFAGFISPLMYDTTDKILELLQRNENLLIILDYTEEHVLFAERLIRIALGKTGDNKVRFIMLARSLGDWWVNLKRCRGGVSDLLMNSHSKVMQIGPVNHEEFNSKQIFLQARNAFCTSLQQTPSDVKLPSLHEPHFERILFIQIAALASIFGRALSKEEQLLDFILDRERDIWRKLSGSGLNVEIVEQAAAFAFNFKGADDRESAQLLLKAAPCLENESNTLVRKVTSILHDLYPGPRWLNGIQPDLLGERLVTIAKQKAM